MNKFLPHQWIKNESNNLIVLNYLLIFYAFSLTVSYKLGGSLLWIILITFLLNENFKQRIVFALKNKIVQACLLYFAVVVLWSIGSDNFEAAIHQIKKYKTLLYSIIFVAITKKDYIEKIILAFVVGMLINVLWSYLMFFGLASSPWNQGYPYLPLLHKTDHGFFVLILLSYALFRIIKYRENRIVTTFFIAVFILESFNIFMTGSRTSMLIYFIMILVSLLYIYKNNIIKVLFLALCITSIIFAIVYIFQPGVINNLKNELHSTKKSITDGNFASSSGTRVGLALYSIPIIKENFFFGVGTANHIPKVKQYVESSIDLNNPDDYKNYQEMFRVFSSGLGASLHNHYIDVIVQFGIIGLIILVNLFYQVYKFKYDNDLYRYLAFVIVSLTIVIINSGYGFGYNNFDKFLIFIFSILSYKNFNTKQNLKNIETIK